MGAQPYDSGHVVDQDLGVHDWPISSAQYMILGFADKARREACRKACLRPDWHSTALSHNRRLPSKDGLSGCGGLPAIVNSHG